MSLPVVSTFSLDFTVLHVTVGLLLILAVLWRSRQKEHYSSNSHFGVGEAAELYWHFVDVVWIILFVLVLFAVMVN